MFRRKYLQLLKVLFLMLVFTSICLSGQRLQAQHLNRNIDVYVLPDRYGEKGLQFFSDHKFISSVLLTRSMIDPKNTGVVDKDVLISNLKRLFPDPAEYGVCFIDWEEPFREMKVVYNNKLKFESLAEEYIRAVNIIKEFNPKLKVGIYGIPFTAFKVSWPVMNANKNKRFDSILSVCDFICPAIYIRFPNHEVGEKANFKYIRDNLDVAFAYSSRLKKEIVPFVWPLVHPNNKKYGMNELSDEDMKSYLGALSSYTKNGISISGVIWFDPKITAAQRNDVESLNRLFKSRDAKVINSLKIFTNQTN